MAKYVNIEIYNIIRHDKQTTRLHYAHIIIPIETASHNISYVKSIKVHGHNIIKPQVRVYNPICRLCAE
jgi:hypothetical protein